MSREPYYQNEVQVRFTYSRERETLSVEVVREDGRVLDQHMSLTPAAVGAGLAEFFRSWVEGLGSAYREMRMQERIDDFHKPAPKEENDR